VSKILSDAPPTGRTHAGGPKTPSPAAPGEGSDLLLGVEGFTYADLHEPRRLADLSARFDAALRESDTPLFEAFDAWRREPSRLGPVDRSHLLVAVAAHLSRFVATLFDVGAAIETLRERALAESPVFAFKKEFVQRRVLRRWPEGKAPSEPFADLDGRWRPRRAALFPEIDFDRDEERGTALAALEMAKRHAALSADAPAEDRASLEADIALLEDWCAARRGAEIAAGRNPAWASFRMPEDLDYAHLVEVIHPDPEFPSMMQGPLPRRRRRDGFKLTDRRFTPREVLDQAHYCVLCHDRDKDSCSKGLKEKQGGVKKNPLGIRLDGCPLDEKISEMHFLARQGDAIGALALVTIDNPMCPGTGHRICNDCMKGCIFQKQEPVNIPQIETGVLTDVLALPYGFEIWDLLTRWNPLNPARPHALPYNGRNVLVVGLGPAGYTLAHYLMNEGFAVIGIDGLKIEPPDPALTGGDGRSPRPIRDAGLLMRELDERPLSGFGGVSEYGITVRWDKNFLTLIQIALTRRRLARFYGGVRFGGTVTLEDAWEMGFDHVAIAAGAGKPTIIDMKNNVMRGVRKASDFLMALQLTGAFKRDALANLEARLPAVIIGGGLTAIDSATELLAYYPVQVEKTLERFETIVRERGEAAALAPYTPEERRRLEVALEHGRAIRAERARAAAAGEEPDFARLVDGWGGVSIAYRKTMQDSPAYRLNHEEVIKALEEGIRFIEAIDPIEAIPDEYGALKAVVFKVLTRGADGLTDAGERRTLEVKTLLVAAGTSPNVTYEKERPGSFGLDDRRQFFRPHRAERGADGRFRPVAAGRDDAGAFFTSYASDGRIVSYFGDNHPRYAGNVVKAMASARDGYPHIVALFADALAALDPAHQPDRDAALDGLYARLDEALLARVVEVNRLTATIVEAVVRAPQAARRFEPGQFFRVQNYETAAARAGGAPLLIEPLALTGAAVVREEGLLSLIALEMGTSSRLLSSLRPGDPVVVMGPTGAPTEIPEGSTLLLAGGGLGNAVLFSIAKAAKERGARVIYFAGYKKAEDLFKREEIEAATDVVVWSVDAGAAIPARRSQDRSFVGNIVQSMTAYGRGDFGVVPISLQEVDRVLAIGSDRMMAAVAKARHGVLAGFLRPDHVGIGSINSPMQCMMKEVCAQCLQRHVDPATGKETILFTCFNQDQPLDRVDWDHLRQRLAQNTVQEKLGGMWLDHLVARDGATAGSSRDAQGATNLDSTSR
jgi:NADPH-dependent glutamate synthase beta subunit-like oxidoreductase/NAD(P)H-flavin reductase